MLETLRQFAAEQLDRLGLTKDVRLRHAQYFDALGTTAAEAMERGDDVWQWAERVVNELDNLRLASTHAGEIGDELLRLRLTTAFADAAGATGRTLETRRVLQEALDFAGEAPALLRARALRALGFAAFVQGDLSAARESYEDALDLHRAMGDDVGSAHALQILAMAIYHDSGAATEARRKLEESRNIFRSRGHTVGLFSVNINLSHLLIQERHLAEATALLEQALDEASSDEERAMILGNLGLSALLDGRPVAAAKLYRGGLQRMQHWHDVDGICHLVEGLAASWIAQGAHIVEAATLFGWAARTRAELGVQPMGEELELVEHSTVEARRLLAEGPYAAAIGTGSSMPISEAVQYALDADWSPPHAQGPYET